MEDETNTTLNISAIVSSKQSCCWARVGTFVSHRVDGDSAGCREMAAPAPSFTSFSAGKLRGDWGKFQQIKTNAVTLSIFVCVRDVSYPGLFEVKISALVLYFSHSASAWIMNTLQCKENRCTVLCVLFCIQYLASKESRGFPFSELHILRLNFIIKS